MESGDDVYLGEIMSGEHWETDNAPVVVKPVFFSITLTPNRVVAKGSVRIQVFVQDVPTSE